MVSSFQLACDDVHADAVMFVYVVLDFLNRTPQQKVLKVFCLRVFLPEIEPRILGNISL